jgi:hypothetical protein
MKDRGRCNVAMTCAIGVFWILGGPLRPKPFVPGDDEVSPFVKLKRKMERLDRVHKLAA